MSFVIYVLMNWWQVPVHLSTVHKHIQMLKPQTGEGNDI